jgi:hypothetical protein
MAVVWSNADLAIYAEVLELDLDDFAIEGSQPPLHQAGSLGGEGTNFFLVTCDERAPAAAVSGARGNLVWALRRTDPQTGQQRLGSSSLNSRQRGTAALQLPDGVAPPTARSLQGHSASSHGCTADGRARLITTPAENATQS